MLNKIALALLGTTAVAISASPASAVSINGVTTNPDAVTRNGVTIDGDEGYHYTNGDTKTVYSKYYQDPYTYTIDFNNRSANDPNDFVTYSNIDGNIVKKGDSGISGTASPAGNNTPYLTIAPSRTGASGNTDYVSMQFQEAIDYFGFHGGSLDDYNWIEIFNDGESLAKFNGDDLAIGKGNGNQQSSNTNRFINIVTEEGVVFDEVKMSTTGIAFETDNHTYRLANRTPKSTPESSTMLGLLVVGACGMKSVFKRLESKVVVK